MLCRCSVPGKHQLYLLLIFFFFFTLKTNLARLWLLGLNKLPAFF